MDIARESENTTDFVREMANQLQRMANNQEVNQATADAFYQAFYALKNARAILQTDMLTRAQGVTLSHKEGE